MNLKRAIREPRPLLRGAHLISYYTVLLVKVNSIRVRYAAQPNECAQHNLTSVLSINSRVCSAQYGKKFLIYGIVFNHSQKGFDAMSTIIIAG